MTRTSVLYVHNSALIGGGNKMLLALFDQLRDSEFRAVAVLPGPGPMEAELRRRDVPFSIVDLEQALRGGRPSGLRSVFGLLRCMRRHEVRLVHGNGPMYYRYAGMAARCMGVPGICHVQLPASLEALRWAFKVPPGLAITCSETLGRDVERMLPRLGCRSAVVPIPNAVDVDRLTPPRDVGELRRRFGLDETAVIVTIVGLVSERKGHPYFLQMARRVGASCPDARFLVVGEDILTGGAYRRAMQAYAAELGIAGRTQFLGFRDDAADLMAASDVIVLPSLQEGLPVALVEAHALGKPVVSTRVDGIPEIVTDGVTGILVPPAESEALADAVLSLVADQALRRRMGDAGRERVERLFSLQAFTENVKAVYRRLLDGDRRSRRRDGADGPDERGRGASALTGWLRTCAGLRGRRRVQPC